MRLFDEREKRIEGAKIEAEKMNTLAEHKSQTFELEYQKARNVARQELNAIKQSADKDQNEIIEKARHSAKEMLKVADAELIAEESKVRSELAEASDQVAHEIINTITEPKLKKFEAEKVPGVAL
jgi:F-type H+-transporting ATPase subunit b